MTITRLNIRSIGITVPVSFEKRKNKYYNNLDIKSFTDNKKFWKSIKPLFSDKHFTVNKITLLDGNDIISEDAEVAKMFNDYFSNVVRRFNVEGYKNEYCFSPDLDNISNIIEKFKNHPSIQKIKINVKVETTFHFKNVSVSEMMNKLIHLTRERPLHLTISLPES